MDRISNPVASGTGGRRHALLAGVLIGLAGAWTAAAADTNAPVAEPPPERIIVPKQPAPVAPLPRAAAGSKTATAALSQGELLKRLLELTDEVTRLRREVDELKAQPAAGRPASAPGAAAGAKPRVPEVEEKPEPDEEVARVERQRAIESVQRSGVLLKRNAWEVEPNFNYSHSSANLISIDGFAILPILVIGDIQSLRIERDIFTASLGLRYGLLDNLQLDVAVPYKYERDRYVTQTQTDPALSIRQETTVNDHGLGDVSFGLSHQVFYERGNLPDVIVSARASAPTGESIFDLPANPGTNQFAVSDLPMGSGLWSLRGGVTAIKSLDPVVLIFNAGYTHRFARDLMVRQIVDDGLGGLITNRVTTSYQPGDTIDYGVAVAIAMNPVLAVNLQIQQRITLDTNLEGIGDIEGSSANEAEFRFGFAWALTRNTVLNFSAAAGLTEDTPDLSLTLALPIKF